jgi:aspartate dehydrogenase
MKKVGIIGCGRIGAPVVKALQRGEAGRWRLACVLARAERRLDGAAVTADPARFFHESMDLIVETAGPAALKQWGPGAMYAANVWTVSGMALADREFHATIEKIGRETGHRMRVLAGAIAGLDALGALAVDPAAEVTVRVDVAPSPEPRARLFAGTAREAALKWPDHVNVAVAAALAGNGLDATQAEVWRPQSGGARSLALSASSRYGRIETAMTPRVVPAEDTHTVAAGIVAALKQADKVIWAG